jgi:hypothetical protein
MAKVLILVIAIVSFVIVGFILTVFGNWFGQLIGLTILITLIVRNAKEIRNG